MPRVSRPLLLLDACVLIDLHEADPSLFRLASRHVGRIHVPLPVLSEAPEPDRSTAARLGIRVLVPTLEELVASARPRVGLSAQDRLCLEMARARGWTCVTNDARLKSSCRSSGVPSLWGLELLARLVAANALRAKRAVLLATAMHQSNPRGISATVLARFVAKITRKR